MSWLRIDDNTMTHPKVAGLPDALFRVWMRTLCACSQHDNSLVNKGLMNEVKDLGPAAAKRLHAAGLLDLIEGSNPHEYTIHNWDRYRPKDPTAAERKRRERDKNRDKTVTGDRDKTVTRARDARARFPTRPDPVLDLPALDSKAGLDFDSAREGLPPSQTLQERDPQDAPGVLLDALTDADQGTETILRNFRLPEYAYRQALEEVTQRGRSAKLAVTILKRIADEQTNPPSTTDPTRTNVQPADPETAIRTMITNGSMTDPIHLEAELTAAGLNGTTADQLRALLPVTTSPDDDIPL